MSVRLRRISRIILTAGRVRGIYVLLSYVFLQEPDENSILEVKNKFLHLLLESGEMREKEFWVRSPEAIREDLAVEYTCLLVGPKDRIPPFESLYHYQPGEARQIWRKATVEIWKMVDSSGLSFKEGYGGIPDNLDLGLEFMEKLVQRKAELWAHEENDGQLARILNLGKKFIDEHLRQWVPDFCHLVASQTWLGYFRNFAEFTKLFTLEERREIMRLSAINSSQML